MAIEIFNSETGKIEIEQVCSEGFLEWLYTSNPFAQIALFAIFKRAFFSNLFGAWADSKFSRNYALNFIKNFKLDTSEFLKSPEEFKTFNEFFTRELKRDARPVSQDKSDLLFPADARHLAFENLSLENSFYIKNRKFNLAKFLGDENLAKRFENGSMMISRLCPTDYHRYHWNVSGKIVARRKIGGVLYSVSPIALRKNLDYLLENKRVLTLVELENGAMCASVEIGATNVGSITHLNKVGDDVQRGDCKGYFSFGGSCTVSIFEKGCVKFNDDILEYSQKPIEYYALANQTCGKILQ